jgi:hypothetical protein
MHTIWAFTRCLGRWCCQLWGWLSKWVTTCCVYPSIFKFLSFGQILHALFRSDFSLVRPCASSSILQYLMSAVSPSSCLFPFLYLLVPSISPSIKCVIRQFLRKMWPAQLSFVPSITCRDFPSSLIFSHTFMSYSQILCGQTALCKALLCTDTIKRYLYWTRLLNIMLIYCYKLRIVSYKKVLGGKTMDPEGKSKENINREDNVTILLRPCVSIQRFTLYYCSVVYQEIVAKVYRTYHRCYWSTSVLPCGLS